MPKDLPQLQARRPCVDCNPVSNSSGRNRYKPFQWSLHPKIPQQIKHCAKTTRKRRQKVRMPCYLLESRRIMSHLLQLENSSLRNDFGV